MQAWPAIAFGGSEKPLVEPSFGLGELPRTRARGNQLRWVVSRMHGGLTSAVRPPSSVGRCTMDGSSRPDRGGAACTQTGTSAPSASEFIGDRRGSWRSPRAKERQKAPGPFPKDKPRDPPPRCRIFGGGNLPPPGCTTRVGRTESCREPAATISAARRRQAWPRINQVPGSDAGPTPEGSGPPRETASTSIFTAPAVW